MMPLKFSVYQTNESITLIPRKMTMNGIILVVFILSMTRKKMAMHEDMSTLLVVSQELGTNQSLGKDAPL